MLDPKQTFRVAPDEVITRLGTRATSMFLVLQGTIGVYSDLEGKTPLMLEDGPVLFTRGTLIGDTEIFTGAPYLTTTRAQTAATLHTISAQRLRSEVEKCSGIVQGLVRVQAGRVRTLVQLLARIQSGTADVTQISQGAVVGEPLSANLIAEAESEAGL